MSSEDKDVEEEGIEEADDDSRSEEQFRLEGLSEANVESDVPPEEGGEGGRGNNDDIGKDDDGGSGNDDGNVVDSAAPTIEYINININDINDLPPLPIPKENIKRKESLNGIGLVSCAIVVFVALTHGVALEAVLPSETIRTTSQDRAYTSFLLMIYVEAGIAICCLLGLLLVDPGTVKRNNENCFPIPDQIKEWLVAVEAVKTPSSLPGVIGSTINTTLTATESTTTTTLKQKQKHHRKSKRKQPSFSLAPPPPSELYITSNRNDDRVYCVRCLVWRQPNVAHFHCTTCQRCVSYFDHHCTVFGRCIAGYDKKDLLRTMFARTGNFRFFIGIISMGVLGYLTTVTSLLYAFSMRYGLQLALPIGFVIVFWINGSIIVRGPSGFCLLCRRCFVQITDFIYRICCNRCSTRRSR